MTPLYEIIADLIPRIGEPMPEAELASRNSAEGADVVAEAWSRYADELPPPSVIAECRRLTDDDTLIRVVNRLAWERRLRGYARGRRFVRLVEYMAAGKLEGAA